MKKKIIACLLMLSFLSYVGCYNISNPVQISQKELESDQTDITVVTIENKRYEFAQGRYQILNDTLSGTGALEQISPSKEIRMMRVILPLSDVVSIQTKKVDPVKTAFLIAGLGLSVWGIVYFISEIEKIKGIGFKPYHYDLDF